MSDGHAVGCGEHSGQMRQALHALGCAGLQRVGLNLCVSGLEAWEAGLVLRRQQGSW